MFWKFWKQQLLEGQHWVGEVTAHSLHTQVHSWGSVQVANMLQHQAGPFSMAVTLT